MLIRGGDDMAIKDESLYCKEGIEVVCIKCGKPLGVFHYFEDSQEAEDKHDKTCKGIPHEVQICSNRFKVKK